MAVDLRARIAQALRDHDADMDGAEPAHEADGEYGCCADAVMAALKAVADKPGHDPRHYTSHGRCRYCGATEEAWPWPEQRRRPHAMYCRLYVGPLKHDKRGSRPGVLGIGWVNECACGRSWRDQDSACPDAGNDYRGDRATEGGAA